MANIEETVVHLEVNELYHHDITPNQSACKDIRNVAVAAEEITENPEYVVMRRSIAIQTFANEEFVIPKLDSARNVMEMESSGMEISSQESVMDIASQESLSVKESNSREPCYCGVRPSVPLHEEVVLAREEDVKKIELECEERLQLLQQDISIRERYIIELERVIHQHQEMIKNQEKQIADQESALKKLESAIKIRELEAGGHKVIPLSRESNGSLPVKRAKKN